MIKEHQPNWDAFNGGWAWNEGKVIWMTACKIAYIKIDQVWGIYTPFTPLSVVHSVRDALEATDLIAYMTVNSLLKSMVKVGLLEYGTYNEAELRYMIVPGFHFNDDADVFAALL